MVNGLRVLISTALCSLASNVASASPIVCPDILSTTEIAIAPDGWTAKRHLPKSQKLTGVSVLNKSAEGTEYNLAPSYESTRRTTLHQEWALNDNRDMEILVLCRYAGGLTLERPVPAPVQSCVAKLTLDGNKRVKAIEQARCD